MPKRGFYLNKERFCKELERHKGETKKDSSYRPEFSKKAPRPARLDKQGEVASIIGSNPRSMSNWVHGREPIPLKYLEALGKLFGCDWQYLCGKADYRNREEEWKERWNNATGSGKNIGFYIAYKVDGTINMSVTCEKTDIKDLILEIAWAGGYPLIMDAIKGLLDPIAPHSGYSQICEGLKELDVYIEKYKAQSF